MSIKKILIDHRWDGDTGIGRLLRNVTKRKPHNVHAELYCEQINLGNPLSPYHLKRVIDKSDAEIFYSPSFMPPLISKVPFVITIHDLNHLYYYTKFHKLYLKYIIANLSKNAKKVITVSQFTKNEIIRELGIESDLIQVIYNGVDESYFLNNNIFKMERPYFLYVGNRRSYKNIDRMLNAFSISNISKDYLLILSGDKDDVIANKIEHLNLSDRVRFLGHIDEQKLPSIYKGAFALLFVSLMEGFGLPILEAMASGTPVITSNLTSMPEVAGDSAILIDPLDVKDIANAIYELTTNNQLQTELKNRGLNRSKNFTWDNTASKTWKTIIE